MVEVGECLLRRQHRAGDTGTAFVDAVIFTIAEVALHVAARRDREMNATVFFMRILAETGMVVEINLGRVHR
jgi:hypothetical protein